jgi:hypothetical protein
MHERNEMLTLNSMSTAVAISPPNRLSMSLIALFNDPTDFAMDIRLL